MFNNESKRFKVPKLIGVLYNANFKKVIWEDQENFKVIDEVVEIENCLSFREFIEKNLDPNTLKQERESVYGESLSGKSFNATNSRLKAISDNLDQSIERARKLRSASYLTEQANKLLEDSKDIKVGEK